MSPKVTQPVGELDQSPGGLLFHSGKGSKVDQVQKKRGKWPIPGWHMGKS